jgi:DNA-binding transcriptional regulator YhcF (GntR family)
MRRREEVCESLRRQVASGLHLGLLRPGERLATARDLARRLGTDYRVVVAAGRQLEREGLVEIRPRAGIFVAAAPAAGAAALPAAASRVVHWLLDDVACGLPLGSFVDRVRCCVESVRLRVACLECNGDQLDFLCEVLGRDFGLETSRVDLDRLALETPRLRHSDLLVTTTHHAGQVRRLAAKLGKPAIVVTLDPVQRGEITRLLAERPVCFVGTDARWARKARLIWGAEAGAANLCTVTLDRDPLAAIPDGAALLLMPAARRRLAGSPLLGRALPARGLSRDSAHEIVSFIVERNLAARRPQAPRAS